MDDEKAGGVERVLYVDGEDGLALIVCQCVGSRNDLGTLRTPPPNWSGCMDGRRARAATTDVAPMVR